jgi:hypothetical protein
MEDYRLFAFMLLIMVLTIWLFAWIRKEGPMTTIRIIAIPVLIYLLIHILGVEFLLWVFSGDGGWDFHF